MVGRGPDGGEGQIGVFGRKKFASDARLSAPADAPELDGESWVVFADGEGIGARLAAALEAAGARCRLVMRGESPVFNKGDKGDPIVIRAGEAGDWTRLFESWAKDGPPGRYVYLWSAEETVETAGEGALLGTDAMLNFSHALDKFVPTGGVRIDHITRGAQPAGRGQIPVEVAQGAAIGLFRVLLSEHPHIACRGIDLDPGDATDDASGLLVELLREETEREVALRGEARYVQRFSRGLPAADRPLDAAVPLRLESRERGILDSLKLTPFVKPEPAPGEVLIAVKAAGKCNRNVLGFRREFDGLLDRALGPMEEGRP